MAKLYGEFTENPLILESKCAVEKKIEGLEEMKGIFGLPLFYGSVKPLWILTSWTVLQIKLV